MAGKSTAQGAFAKRVIVALKEGDESKVLRFETRLGKYFDNQVEDREKKIENLREKISDAEEALEESILKVELSRIIQIESTDSYIPTYVSNLNRGLTVVEGFEEEIATIEGEIAKLKKLKTLIFGEDKKATKATKATDSAAE